MQNYFDLLFENYKIVHDKSKNLRTLDATYIILRILWSECSLFSSLPLNLSFTIESMYRIVFHS